MITNPIQSQAPALDFAAARTGSRVAALLLAASLVLAGQALAVTPQVWAKSSQAAFELGKFEHVSLSETGELQPAPIPQRSFEGAGETFVWCLAAGPGGELYAGTAPHGRVYRQSAAGKWEPVLETGDVAVTAIAFGRDGTLFAAAIPSGSIHRMAGGKPVTPPLATGQRYVWALAVDSEGRLLAATGLKARVLRFGPEQAAAPSVLLESPEEHILCLSLEADGAILAGSAGHGLLYRLPPAGPPEVLFSAPQDEIRALARIGDTLYVAAQTGPKTFPASRPPPSSALSSGLAPLPNLSSGRSAGPRLGGKWVASFRKQSRPELVKLLSLKLEAPKQGARGRPAGAPPKASQTAGEPAPKPEALPPAPVPPRNAPKFGRAGNKSQTLFALGPSGVAVPVLSTDQEVLLSLAAVDGRLVVGTGNGGVLFRVERDRTLSRWVNLEESQALALLAGPDGSVFVGTGNPGRVYRLSPEQALRGVYTSEPLDGGQVSRWGRLTWNSRGASPVRLSVRSGNSKSPDLTWSEWSEAPGPQATGPLAVPAARYLQARAEFFGRPGEDASVLETLRLTYLPRNAPPSIDSMEFTTAAFEPYSEHLEPTVRERNRRADEQKKRPPEYLRRLKWEASDPNKDSLSAVLFFRESSERQWKPLMAEPTAANEFEWDTRTVPDGTYRLRLVVSDLFSNPPAEALTASRELWPIVVDNTPPVLSTFEVTALSGGTAAVVLRADDGPANLWTFEYQLDNGEWTPVMPADGLADSAHESAELTLAGLASGEHVLTVRVRDENGNVGAGRKVFTMP
jgi:hypothetical protein